MRSITYAVVALIVITITSLFSSPAFATTATWTDNGNWDIQGYSKSQFCQLNVYYERDELLAVLVGNLTGGPAMGFSSRNLRPLTENAEIVEASLRFSNNEHYQIVGKVLSPTLIFTDVPEDAIGDFASTAWVEVRVRGILIGTYNLTGTSNMVTQLNQCARAMTGDPA